MNSESMLQKSVTQGVGGAEERQPNSGPVIAESARLRGVTRLRDVQILDRVTAEPVLVCG